MLIVIIFIVAVLSNRRYDAVVVSFDVSARLNFNVSRLNRRHLYIVSLSVAQLDINQNGEEFKFRDNLNINGIILKKINTVVLIINHF